MKMPGDGSEISLNSKKLQIMLKFIELKSSSVYKTVVLLNLTLFALKF